MEALLFANAPDPVLVVERIHANPPHFNYVYSLYVSKSPANVIYVLVGKSLNQNITGVFTCAWFDGTIYMQVSNNGFDFTCDLLTGAWNLSRGPIHEKSGTCDPAVFLQLLPPVTTGVSPKHNTDATRFVTEDFDMNAIFVKIKSLK